MTRSHLRQIENHSKMQLRMETWLIHREDMTHSYTKLDSFIDETWRIYTWLILINHEKRLIHTRDMTYSHKSWDTTHSYTRHDASTHDLHIIYSHESWVMGHESWVMGHDSFTHETSIYSWLVLTPYKIWLIHTRNMRHPHMTYSHSTHDLFSLYTWHNLTSSRSTHDWFSTHDINTFIHETWRIHTWLILTPHMTSSHSTHDIISLPADLHMTDSLRMTYSIHMTYSLHKTYSIHTTYFHLRQIYIWHPYMTYSPFRWIENHSVTHMRHDSFT